MLSVLGIPFDENSSFLKGSSKAPQKIIKAFYSDASNAFSENGFNCRDTKKLKLLMRLNYLLVIWLLKKFAIKLKMN